MANNIAYSSQDILDFLAKKAGYDRCSWQIGIDNGNATLLLAFVSNHNPMHWTFAGFSANPMIGVEPNAKDANDVLCKVLELSSKGKTLSSDPYVWQGQYVLGVDVLPAYSTLESLLVEIDLRSDLKLAITEDDRHSLI